MITAGARGWAPGPHERCAAQIDGVQGPRPWRGCKGQSPLPGCGGRAPALGRVEPAAHGPEFGLGARDAEIGEHPVVGVEQVAPGAGAPAPLGEDLPDLGAARPQPGAARAGGLENFEQDGAHRLDSFS